MGLPNVASFERPAARRQSPNTQPAVLEDQLRAACTALASAAPFERSPNPAKDSLGNRLSNHADRLRQSMQKHAALIVRQVRVDAEGVWGRQLHAV